MMESADLILSTYVLTDKTDKPNASEEAGKKSNNNPSVDSVAFSPDTHGSQK